MGSECERCGVTEEDYGSDWDNYGGQELCEQCCEEAMEEEKENEEMIHHVKQIGESTHTDCGNLCNTGLVAITQGGKVTCKDCIKFANVGEGVA